MRRRSRKGTTIDVGTRTVEHAGAILCVEGAVGREAFLIEEGSVSVSRGGVRIACLGPGDLAGEQALLAGPRRNATLVAETDVAVTVYNGGEFDYLMKTRPPIAAS